MTPPLITVTVPVGLNDHPTTLFVDKIQYIEYRPKGCFIYLLATGLGCRETREEVLELIIKATT